MEHSKYNIPKPSEIMRAKRPYLFSDSENTDAYRLSQSELSHQLDSLTDRNQHKDFENFARKICEREICPNLRPQTGPEGGGDGKVDTETYPVDTKISERWFVGDGRSGQEKWAFAFSAKKAWSDKIRSDVKGIIETKRDYEKIFFVTSRPTVPSLKEWAVRTHLAWLYTSVPPAATTLGHRHETSTPPALAPFTPGETPTAPRPGSV